MAYSTKDGVRQVLAPDGSTDPSLGTAAVLSDAEITEAISEADAQIDARLSARYTVPFDPVPTEVEKLSRDIAAYRATLLYRRNTPIPVDDPIRLRYATAAQFLDQLSKGQAELIGATGEVGQASEAAVENEYDGALFALDDFGLVKGEVPTLGGMGRYGPFGRTW